MVNHGTPRYTMLHHGIPWYTNLTPRYSMVHHVRWESSYTHCCRALIIIIVIIKQEHD